MVIKGNTSPRERKAESYALPRNTFKNLSKNWKLNIYIIHIDSTRTGVGLNF